MRGLARHSRPYLLPVGAASSANRVSPCEKKHSDEHGLEQWNDSQPPHQRSITIMNRARVALADGAVLHVEVVNVVPDFRRIQRSVQRKVCCIGGISAAIGDDERDA